MLGRYNKIAPIYFLSIKRSTTLGKSVVRESGKKLFVGVGFQNEAGNTNNPKGRARVHGIINRIAGRKVHGKRLNNITL